MQVAELEKSLGRERQISSDKSAQIAKLQQQLQTVSFARLFFSPECVFYVAAAHSLSTCPFRFCAYSLYVPNLESATPFLCRSLDKHRKRC